MTRKKDKTMNLLEQIKQPVVFEFNPECINELYIHYCKKWESPIYGGNGWVAAITFTKDNITSKVGFEAKTYKELYGKMNEFLSKL